MYVKILTCHYILFSSLKQSYKLTRLPWWHLQVKNPPAPGRPGFDPWVGKIPWRGAQQPTQVFLSGESPLSSEELMLLNHGVGEDP